MKGFDLMANRIEQVMERNTLYYGDCLDWMQKWDENSIDLIYLDPPFNSDADYNMLFSNETSDSQYRAFADTWTWDEAAADRFRMFANSLGRPAHNVIVGLYQFLGDSGMMAYLTYMAERLEQMHRLLKPTGSIYLHCDSTANHYLKIVLDAIFGKDNFRNEIVWERSSSGKTVKNRYANDVDYLLLFGKSSEVTFNQSYKPLSQSTLDSYSKDDYDGRGRYASVSLQKTGNPGPQTTYDYIDNNGKIWKCPVKGWRMKKEKLKVLENDGRLILTGTVIREKSYWNERKNKGKVANNLWDDIPNIQGKAKEKLGYPTQKPIKLLNRVIEASSNEGDLVLDPFCGCGTAVDAARKSKRNWIGIDISSFAIDLIKNLRLKDPDIPVKGIPFGMASARQLAADNPFSFESWAISRIPGFVPNTKRVGDGGIDGRASLTHKPDQPVYPPPHEVSEIFCRSHSPILH